MKTNQPLHTNVPGTLAAAFVLLIAFAYIGAHGQEIVSGLVSVLTFIR